MKMLENFFSPVVTGIPPLPMWLYILTLAVLVFLTWFTVKNRENTHYKLFWTCLLTGQLALIYAWFCWAKVPLSELLPLYHCRIAMFAILFLPRGILKDYFSLLGFSGGILAVAYPVIYAYPLFHVTNVFFYVGHYALLALCLLHILQSEGIGKLTLKQIAIITFGLNAFLVVVNQLTGGNYGFLSLTPLLNSQNVLVNYLAVSGVLIILVVLFALLFGWLKNRIVQLAEKTF